MKTYEVHVYLSGKKSMKIIVSAISPFEAKQKVRKMKKLKSTAFRFHSVTELKD